MIQTIMADSNIWFPTWIESSNRWMFASLKFLPNICLCIVNERMLNDTHTDQCRVLRMYIYILLNSSFSVCPNSESFRDEIPLFINHCMRLSHAQKMKKKSEVVKVNKKYLTRLLKRSRIKRYSESYSSRRMPVFNVDSPVEYYTLSTSRNILNETVYMSISYVIRATVHLKVNSLLIAVPYIHIELVPCANQNVHVQLVV